MRQVDLLRLLTEAKDAECKRAHCDLLQAERQQALRLELYESTRTIVEQQNREIVTLRNQLRARMSASPVSALERQCEHAHLRKLCTLLHASESRCATLKLNLTRAEAEVRSRRVMVATLVAQQAHLRKQLDDIRGQERSSRERVQDENALESWSARSRGN